MDPRLPATGISARRVDKCCPATGTNLSSFTVFSRKDGHFVYNDLIVCLLVIQVLTASEIQAYSLLCA